MRRSPFRAAMRTRVATCVRTLPAMAAAGLLGCADVSAPMSPAEFTAGAASSNGRSATPRLRVYSDSFRAAPTQCAVDGAVFGEWSVVYTGYGCVQRGESGSSTWLAMAPQAVGHPDLTSAPLVVGPSFSGYVDFSVRAITDAQLRTGSPPNPWEVAWLAWHYSDPEHFYYFIPKPNGWELGKRDPAYPGGQRFLATGESPRYEPGRWTDFRVVQDGNRMTVYLDGRPIVSYTDAERPYTSGRIGLYSEDAAVRFSSVRVLH